MIKSRLEDFIESPESDHLADTPAAPVPAEPAPAPAKPEQKVDTTLYAHLSGTVVPMEEVQDEVFASGVLGQGVAIEPSEGNLYAPADCVVDNLFDTKHTIGLMTDDGLELLLHIGINTVKLKGEFFEAHVKTGQRVKTGDLLISFDMEKIRQAGYLCTTPMIVCNSDDGKEVKVLASGKVQAGTALLSVKG